ncbi:MAG: phosphoribosyltransferase [Cryobacterium sp.]
MPVFTDRVEAGRCLAEELEYLRGHDIVVLGLPRGGVPVAFEVAAVLDAPLDVIVVRKLGVPFQPEWAMGAIGENGVRIVNAEVLAVTGVTPEQLDVVERRERDELTQRLTRFRSGRDPLSLSDKIAVIVDDGIATGATARVACQVARRLGAARVILAVPVAPADTVREITEADEVVCVSTPRIFEAVGLHYRDFTTTTDDEVVALLDAAARRGALPGPPES